MPPPLAFVIVRTVGMALAALAVSVGLAVARTKSDDPPKDKQQ